MKTPDVTLAQIVAIVKNALAVAIAFGAPITPSERVSILALSGSLGIALIAADAMIRRARAQHLAGPLADHAAAVAIATASSAAKGRRVTSTIASEAALEAAATAENAGATSSPIGVDPALAPAPPVS